MRLLTDVYLVGSGRTGFGISDPYDCNVYLIDGGDEAALVDAGAGIDLDPLLANLDSTGVPRARIRTLILTHGHFDHSGGAAKLRALLGCRVLVGAADAADVAGAEEVISALAAALPSGTYPAGYVKQPCPVDGTLADGDEIAVGRYRVAVMHTPGHSPGAVCLVMQVEGQNVLFTGDTIQFCPVAGHVGWISLLNAPGTDLPAYQASARRLAALRVDVLLPGHRLFALSDGRRIIRSVADGFETLSIPRSVV